MFEKISIYKVRKIRVPVSHTALLYSQISGMSACTIVLGDPSLLEPMELVGKCIYELEYAAPFDYADNLSFECTNGSPLGAGGFYCFKLNS